MYVTWAVFFSNHLKYGSSMLGLNILNSFGKLTTDIIAAGARSQII